MTAAPAHWLSAAAAAAVGLLVLLGPAGPAADAAAADVGVSLSTGAVAVDVPIEAGRDLDLPPVSVVNPGDLTSTYRLEVVPDLSGGAREVPRSWVELDRTEVQVGPGGAVPFRTRLSVPSDAPSGRYEVVVSSALASTAEGAVGTGAAAGVRISFVVAASDAASAPGERTAPTNDAYAAPRGSVTAPAPALVLLGAGAVGVAWMVLRRRRGGDAEVAS